MDAFIRHCHGTLAEWTQHDPVLAKGEVVLVATDAAKPTEYNCRKVGDGQKKFSQLPLLGFDCLPSTGTSTLQPMSQKATTEAIAAGAQAIITQTLTDDTDKVPSAAAIKGTITPVITSDEDTVPSNAAVMKHTDKNIKKLAIRNIIKEIYCPNVDWRQVAYVQTNLLYKIGEEYANAIYLKKSDDTLVASLLEKIFSTVDEAKEHLQTGFINLSGNGYLYVGQTPDSQYTESIYDYYDISVLDNSPVIRGMLKSESELLSELEGREYVQEIYAPKANMNSVDHIDVNLLYLSGGKYYNVAYLRNAEGVAIATLFSFSYDSYEDCLADLQKGFLANGQNVIWLGKIPASSKSISFYNFYDISNINNSPKILNTIYPSGLSDNAILNSFVREIYTEKVHVSEITAVTLNVAYFHSASERYYNSLYLRKGDSTVVIFDENFTTEEEAVVSFNGIKGGGNGYALLSSFGKTPLQLNKPVGFNHPLTIDYAPTIRASLSPTLPVIGRKVVWEGDSLMADNSYNNTGWRKRIENRYGMHGSNYSRGGSTFTANLEGLDTAYNISLRIDSVLEENPDTSYFILDGGGNDADRVGRIVQYSDDSQTKYKRKDNADFPVKFGSWTDTDFSGVYDINTFCGAVEYVFYKLMTSYRGVKVGFIVAPKMGRAGLTYFNRLEYLKEIMAIARKWGVPCINLWEESLMNPNIPNQYNSDLDNQGNVEAGSWYLDGQHPTPSGYDYSASLIADWMCGL